MADLTHPHDETFDPTLTVARPGEDVEDDDVETESANGATEEEEKSREENKGTMQLMRRQFRSINDGTKTFREEAAVDARFRMGVFGDKKYQWRSGIAEERAADGRPCITVNKAGATVHQITNQARQARLRIHVSPVDDKGDVKVAETIQGMLRNVEAYSFADRAYYMGSDKQAEQGLGYLFLTVEDASDDPEDLENLFRVRMRIKQVMDPLSVYTDASAMEADFSDADFQFKVTDVDTDTWKLVTGKKKPPTESIFEAFQDGREDKSELWFPNGRVRMVQWWNREPYGARKHMALMSNGEVIPYPDAKTLARYEAKGYKIKRAKWAQRRCMVWRTCDALDIHETTIWSGEAVPHIPVIGDALLVDGQRDWRGALRDSRGPAEVYNVHVSGLTEAVGLGQKTPVVGVEGQFGPPDSPMRKAWETAHKKPKAFLEYKNVQIEPGRFADRPSPMQFQLPMEGILLAIHQADEDYKSTSGQHDASLGERGPQEAARAIEARKQQDTLGNSHYLDNLRFSMASLARQGIKVLRATVDVATVVRIKGNDERERKVMVFSGKENDPRNDQWLQTHNGAMPMQAHNGQMIQPGDRIPYQPPDGVTEIFDIGTGEFDVEVNAGPDPGTRREHELELVVEIFKNMPPELAMKFLDLEFSLIDSAVGRQLMERAKKLLPEGLRDDEESGKPTIPPEALAKIQQLTEQRDMVMQAAKKMQEELKSKKYAVDAGVLTAAEERRMKFKIETLKQRIALIMQTKEIKAEQALALFEAQVNLLETQNEQNHAKQMSLLEGMWNAADSDADRQHEAETATADRAHEQINADADRQLQVETAESDRRLQADLAVLGHSVTAATPPEEPAPAEGTA